MISVSCLIPAAGWGERFRRSSSDLPPKIDLVLGGERLLERTLRPFLATPDIREIVVAVPQANKSRVAKRLRDLVGSSKIKVVAGGKTRTESVENALRASDPDHPWVIVHDGARPMLSSSALSAFLEELPKSQALIMARPVHPTLKRARGTQIIATVSRENLWEAETPQGFHRSLLEKAYQNFSADPFPATDEASLVERLGVPIFLFKNNSSNLKITEFADYEVARKLLGADIVTKTGIGFDIHRLVKGRPLVLGGLRIPHTKGTLGHSDGDAVLHALSDALLGALALGDIGDYFSDRSKKTKGMDSTVILRKVYALVTAQGYELNSADINLILECPKLGTRKLAMRTGIARLLEVPVSRVSLKARTAEGLGSVGKGEAVSAEAVVTLVKRG